MSQGNSRACCCGATSSGIYFVFTPIVTSFIFSAIPIDSDDPWATSRHWYETIFADPDVWDAFRVSGIVSITVAILAFIGFCTAYTDYRYNFTGKLYLTRPPAADDPAGYHGTRDARSARPDQYVGQIYSIVVSHVVLCSPFAMA